MSHPGDRRADAHTAGFEQGPAPVVVTEGPRHRVVALNAAARGILGASCLGAGVEDAFPGLSGGDLSLWSETWETGVPQRANGCYLEPGAAGPAEAYDLLLAPWRGPAGEVVGVIAELLVSPVRLRPENALPELATPGRSSVASALQEAVLPRHVPVLPLADVAATYLLGDADTGFGGDWFDAVPTRDGRLALVAGDVAGRGVEAVATMGQLRAVLCERLRTGSGPEETMAAVDALAADVPGAAATTVCLAVLDPGSGRLVYCTAGHPPPLVARPDGTASYLERSGGGALATRTTFPVLECALEQGDLLLLYTDGAIKRPSRTAAQNALDLASVVGDVFGSIGGGHGIRGTVDKVCTRVLSRLVARTGHRDDVALLGAERMPPPYLLDLRLPAEPDSVRAARTALSEWLHELRVRDLDTMATIHAVGEVVSNAVEHAYVGITPPGEDAVTVTARLETPGEAAVTVRDRGRWRGDGSTRRGRGLTMARGFADDLRVERGPDGTTVTLRHQLGRAVQMFSGEGTPRSDPGSAQRVHTHAQVSGRVRVDGAVDEQSVEDLREDLMHWTRGGTTSLVVDLSGVSFLGSAGVQLLAEVMSWTDDAVRLELVAAPGSPAQHVLEVVGLPYRAA